MNWDIYFLRIAKEVSQNTKCLSRKIGAIIVKDRAILSTGYNGPPRGAKHCNERTMDFYNDLEERFSDCRIEGDYLKDDEECPRRIFGYKSGEGLHLCQAGHAERNAIIQAARNGISTLGTTLYCYCALPCKDCSIEIVNAGIKEIVCFKGDLYDKYSPIILKEAGINVKEIEKDEIHK